MREKITQRHKGFIIKVLCCKAQSFNVIKNKKIKRFSLCLKALIRKIPPCAFVFPLYSITILQSLLLQKLSE